MGSAQCCSVAKDGKPSESIAKVQTFPSSRGDSQSPSSQSPSSPLAAQTNGKLSPETASDDKQTAKERKARASPEKNIGLVSSMNRCGEPGTLDDLGKAGTTEAKGEEEKNDTKEEKNDTKGEGEKNDTHFQVKRVESKDERDFAHNWDVSARVVADLQVQDHGDVKRTSARLTEIQNEEMNHTRMDGGLSLSFPVTFEEAEKLRANLCQKGGTTDGLLNKWVAMELLQQFNEQFAKKYPCAVAEITVPAGGNVVVVGDTHGQLQDVLFIFHTFGPPTASNVYLFNGDVADRGHNSCEIFFLIFAYFLADPSCIIINRGNHENPELNATSAGSGGGFRDEVLTKYMIRMYEAFVQMMCLIPLCTVIEQQVFVVHGGITESVANPKLTLDQIRSIDHTEFCCPEPETMVVQEQVWTDLIWSDPTPRKGAHASQRGAGIRFGPDVTERFLKNNSPLRMIIRGHELPDGQRGYQKVHSDRVLTVFSASNYCGDTGNQGAVAVFKKADFPHYTLHEYFAPSLRAIAKLVGQGKQEWATEGRLLAEADREAKDRCWWPKELNKLMMTIVEMKPQIWTKFHDASHGLQTVDHDTWVKLLSEVVGTHWHWEMAWTNWGLGSLDAKIDFTGFLRRFSVVLQHDGLLALKYKSIATCFESILQQHGSLTQTLAKFDQDGDGTVTVKELRQALLGFDLGLSRAQIDSMLHILFNGEEVNGVAKMPVKEFLGRFTMVYKHADDVLCAGERTDEERLLHDTMSQIAHVIASHSTKEMSKCLNKAFEGETAKRKGSKGSEKKVPITHHIAKKMNKTGGKEKKSAASASSSAGIALKIEKIFEIMDTGHDGFVNADHFVRGLWAVPGMQQLRLQNGELLSQDVLRRCALLLDKSGQISILELLEAFCFEDSHQGDGMADALAEHMLAVLFRYRQAVRAGARYFDPEAKGKVTEDQFSRVLHAVNKQIEETGLHFTDSQIADLANAISVEDKGRSMVPYDEFFNSFEIVDAQNAAMGVSLKSTSA